MILGQKNASERVVSVLLKLSERIGFRDNGGRVVALPMGRADLADYTGLTIETVSRTFTHLRRQGIIETPDARSVHIVNSEQMARHTGDY